jgi:hypothetical protein
MRSSNKTTWEEQICRDELKSQITVSSVSINLAS